MTRAMLLGLLRAPLACAGVLLLALALMSADRSAWLAAGTALAGGLAALRVAITWRGWHR